MKGGGQMRRRKGSSFSGRHRLRGRVVRWALLAAVVVLVLACGYGCPWDADLPAQQPAIKKRERVSTRSLFLRYFPSEYGSWPETVSTSVSSSSER